jgi:tetratricopeptide (TPR) repeat protein
VLGDTPADPEARLLLAEARFELCAYMPALADAQRALADARTASSGPELEARCARLAAEILRVLGRPTDSVGVLEKLPKGAEPADAEGAWALGSALWDAGRRRAAKTVLARGAATPDEQGWRGLLARGRCQRRLGDLEGASTSYVAADEKSRAEEGSSEPDVLAALGDVYFEADREVDAAKKRSPADRTATRCASPPDTKRRSSASSGSTGRTGSATRGRRRTSSTSSSS